MATAGKGGTGGVGGDGGGGGAGGGGGLLYGRRIATTDHPREVPNVEVDATMPCRLVPPRMW